MVKIINDKYYTPIDLAKRLIKTTFRELVKNGYTEITDIIEPSAGNGAFSNQIKCTAYDIEPESEGIIKADFLQEPIDYKKGRLCIGNPPFGCLVEDTEVYTNRGWLSFNDITYNDMCLSVNIKTKEIEWSKIKNIIKRKINEDVYYFKSSNLDLKVTREHRMFAYDKFSNEPKIDRTNDVYMAENFPYTRSCIQKFGYKWIGNDNKTFILPKEIIQYNNHIKIIPEQRINMKDWAEFFGLWIADGCCRHTNNSNGNKRYTISIKQHKSTLNKVLDICNKLPFNYKIYENKNQDSFNIDINSKQLWKYLIQFGYSKDKWIPDCIKNNSVEVIKSFMNGYTFGDSKKIKKYIESKVCNTISKKLIEDLQICLLKLGQMVNYNISREKYKNEDYLRYNIRYHPNKIEKNNTIYFKKPKIEKYNGMVYCVSLEKNGFFLIRRNNKICFTGNCSNSLSVKFYNKCCEIGDYIGFIQPISQLNNNLQMYQFDLIYSEDLGEIEYSDRKLRCCYNIFVRPKNGQLNPKPDFRLKDITIIEHRRKKGDYKTGANKEISPDFDYAICNFGNSCFGKVPEFVGQYANELYFYCHKKEFLPKMLELLEFNKVREFAQSIAMKKMSMMRFYKYLGENIEGIE